MIILQHEDQPEIDYNANCQLQPAQEQAIHWGY